MLNKKHLDNLCQKLSEALPDGLREGKEKCQQQFKSILQSAFEKLDLVTREDFDRQAKYLQELKEKLADLEARLNNCPPSS